MTTRQKTDDSEIVEVQTEREVRLIYDINRQLKYFGIIEIDQHGAVHDLVALDYHFDNFDAAAALAEEIMAAISRPVVNFKGYVDPVH